MEIVLVAVSTGDNLNPVRAWRSVSAGSRFSRPLSYPFACMKDIFSSKISALSLWDGTFLGDVAEVTVY